MEKFYFFMFGKDGIQISVFYFSLYYNVNGVSMAQRHWKIPTSSFGEKIYEFPTRGFATLGKFIFFAVGFGGNFPMPPPHTHAISSLPSVTSMLKQCFYLVTKIKMTLGGTKFGL